MSKIKLNIESKSLIEIEAPFGSIFINATDVELPKKVDKMFDLYNEGISNIKAKEVIAKKKGEYKDEDMIADMKEFIETIYQAINAVFGKGATKKIFQYKSLDTLESFLEQMPMILEQAGVKTKEYVDERLKSRSKYAPTQIEGDSDTKVLG